MTNQDYCSNLYKTMLENMQDGFMHCKAIRQSKGTSIDYEVVTINKSFRETLQLSAEQINGKRLSVISSINKYTEFCFGSLFNQLKPACGESSFELYNPFLQIWHLFSVFFDGNSNYTILIKDITDNVIFSEHKNIYNNAVDLFCTMDFQCSFINYNLAWERILGYSANELKSKTLWDIVHIEDENKASKLHENSLAAEKVISFETQCICKDSARIWLQFNVYPILEKRLLYAVARDITEQKKLEEQLRENEETWRFALEGSETGAWYWDIEKNQEVFSSTWKKMLGYEEDELLSGVEAWASRVHPDDIKQANKMTLDYLRGIIPAYNCEHRLRCKDGQYKWVLSRAKIVKRSPEGKPLRMSGIHTDITELKNLVEELKELTDHYEIVFNGTQDALFLVSVDDDGKFRYERLSSSHERLTGLKTELVKGKTPQEIVGRRLGKKIEAAYYRCIKAREVIRYEEAMELPAGYKIWYTRLSPVIRDGKVAYIVGSSRDITEQKLIEESKKKADNEIKLLAESIAYENLKTEFFSNLSHELRTPLNVILCSVQLTNLLIGNSKDEHLKSSLSRNMRIMKQNSYRLLRLVNNLIDITKIDSGYFNLYLENCDIVKLLADITMSIETYVQNKGIKLSFHSEINKRLMAIDMDKIERIILNVLSNAVKFTEAGGMISVNLYEEADFFFISVSDTGIGIPEEKLDIIFNRFIQVDKSLVRSHEGSGIGLALVKSLVELHGGKVSVESKLGEGSEFLIELPISLVDEMREGGLKQSKINRNVVERIDIEFSDIYA